MENRIMTGVELERSQCIWVSKVIAMMRRKKLRKLRKEGRKEGRKESRK